ncbi:MAG: hypothetical protein WC506_05400 [Candidatus Micrarchaeia archaeon]
MQDGTFNPAITLFSQQPRSKFRNSKLFSNMQTSPEKMGLGYQEKNTLAKAHIMSMLGIMKTQDREKMRSFLNKRSADLLNSRRVEDGAQYVQLLFEMRSKIIFAECERLLQEVATGTITYSFDIYSSLEKNTVFDTVTQLRKEASGLLSRMGQVQDYKSSGSHLNYYKKVADIAAHYQALKILCSLDEFDAALSPLDYYFAITEQHDYSSKELRHLEGMKHLFMLADLESALNARGIVGKVENAFSSEILKMPFYTREFL